MTTVALEGLSVGYRTRSGRESFSLSGIDASVEAGQLVCLLGPNGSGKSTLLRTIAGFQPALAGAVRFEGRAAESLAANERARYLSVVLTERVDAGLLDGRDLVALGRYPYTAWTGRLSPADRRAVEWALDAVGALELAARSVMSLSDGERQKIMIARALAQEPRLILLDEPTAFLDLPRKVETMTLLGRLARETGCAVLLSTHELELAQALADRLWLIRPSTGRLAAGAPEDLALAGEFDGLFVSTAVRYDEASGRFSVGRPPTRRALLRGSGLPRRLTERALARVGFEAIEVGGGPEAGRDTPVITVQPILGGHLWTLTQWGETHSYQSIGELVTALERPVE